MMLPYAVGTGLFILAGVIVGAAVALMIERLFGGKR